MKLYINKPSENWVVDRFVSEWNNLNFQTSSNYFGNKIIWLIAPWTWNKIPRLILNRKKVLCTIHHIDEDKFNKEAKLDFYSRDKFVDLYHVISKKTFDQVAKLTDKQIVNIPFWVNQNLWFQIDNKEHIYNKYKLNKNRYFIGSFQRDTEGFDLRSPKLSKGPDQFLKIVKEISDKNKNVTVILTGKRRQYLIENLIKEKIDYKYFEMGSFEEINELYNILNLYIVASRYEGGPQSILECSLTRTPIISTDVGIASEILSPKSIFNMENISSAEPDIEHAYKNAQKFTIPNGFDDFTNTLLELHEN